EKIEICIKKYMNLEQTMTYLHENHQITHNNTRTIWERLQRGNPDFFKEYYKRCEVARQITQFNGLLAQQVYLMNKFREIELRDTTAPEHQFATLLLPEQPAKSESWINLDFGDGYTNNNGSDPTYDLQKKT
ncbi:unnamed protein product, partial [Thlaspi arvense]